MLNLNKWSIKQKVLTFAGTLVFGGGLICVIALGVINSSARTQRLTVTAMEVDRKLLDIQTQYFMMSEALSSFVASNSQDDWKRKLEADEKAAALVLELKKMELSEELRPCIEQLERFEDRELNPMDEKVREYMKAHSLSETLQFIKENFYPLRREAQRMIGEALTHTERGMLAASRKAEKVVYWGQVILAVSILGGTLFGFIICWWVASWLGKSLGNAVMSLETESAKARQATVKVNSASQGLAQAATEQAAALQETAASIEEMSAMINKSAENAGLSGDVSKESVSVATRGKQAAGEMIQAIHDINESNSQIMNAIEASNQKITEITKVIAEIGSKTKVINDIVFQTKLLSFNASVEAARAGEHGKGFAVVAEEVGNLAQMSGNAAKEISSMLDSSIAKVEGIVTETRSTVETLIASGKAKVATGTRIAEESGKVLDEIMEKVNKVNGMVDEISTATREQASGVTEINKAMTQLDQVTQENSTLSSQIAATAGELAQQTQMVRSVVHQLEKVIWGEGVKNDAPAEGIAAATRTNATAKITKPEKKKSKIEAKAKEPIAGQGKSEPSPAAPKPQAAAQMPLTKAEPAVAPKAEVKPVASPQARSTSLPHGPVSPTLAEESLPSESDPRFKEI